MPLIMRLVRTLPCLYHADSVCAVEYTAARVDAALFTAVAMDAAFYTAVRVDAALFTAVGVDADLNTAVCVYAAYILRLGWVLPFSIVVGVVAAPFRRSRRD